LVFDRKSYIRKYNKEYYSKPEIKEKMVEYYKEYYKRPEVIKRRKIYRDRPENKEKTHLQQKRYCQTDHGKEVKNNGNRRYKANKNNIIEIFTTTEWNIKKVDSEGFCYGYECERHFVGVDNLELDHIYPVSIASKDFIETGIKRIYTIDDIQPLCRDCNNRKNNKVKI